MDDPEGKCWSPMPVTDRQIVTVMEQIMRNQTKEDNLRSIFQFVKTSHYILSSMKEIAKKLQKFLTYKAQTQALRNLMLEPPVAGPGQIIADGGAGGGVVVNVGPVVKAEPVVEPVLAETAMHAMVEAKNQLDASLAECKKAMEKYEKSSLLFDEAMKADNESKKHSRA
jgi:hypothetical protein